MKPMDMIDRYITDVGKDLPRKNRLDIEAEILSALEDMLSERSQKTGKPVDEQMTVEVLKQYGAPRKVAASYQPERTLIGPRLFPSFVTVVEVILLIVAAIALVKIGISLGQVEEPFDTVFETVFLGIAKFLGTAFTALGIILVLFVIVQWVLPEFKENSGEWDPYKLPEATPRNRVEARTTLLGIFGSGLAIVLFNFFPQLIINIGYHADGTWWIGFIANEADSVWSGTILSDAFFHYLPALTILWVLSLFLDVALLSRGRWETWTRWSALVLKVMTIALVGIMLPGPALVSANAEALIAAGFPDPLATRLAVNFVEQGTIVVLVITVIASIITVLRLLTRLTGRNLSPALEKFAHP